MLDVQTIYTKTRNRSRDENRSIYSSQSKITKFIKNNLALTLISMAPEYSPWIGQFKMVACNIVEQPYEDILYGQDLTIAKFEAQRFNHFLLFWFF